MGEYSSTAEAAVKNSAVSARSATTDSALVFYRRAAGFDAKIVELALSLHGRDDTNYAKAVLE